MPQTIETWRPPGDSQTLWQLLSGGGPTPEGDGWSITGYTPAQVAFGKGFQNVNVPTYQRVVGQAAAPAPAAAPPPAPAPQPTYQPKPAVPDNFQPTAPAPIPATPAPTQQLPAQPDLSPLTKQLDTLSQQLAAQQANYAQQLQASQAGYESQLNSIRSMYDQQFSSMRGMYDQQMNALNMRIQDMNNANNQDSWRIRAAQQAGSASADSVQSGQYAPPAGTQKLNRGFQPYGTASGSNNFLASLLNNPTLGGLSNNPLLIGGVNI